MKAVLVWGNQLNVQHNTAMATAPDVPIIMIEAWNVCRAHKYHKQKLVLVLSAMRSFRDELLSAGKHIIYVQLDPAKNHDWLDELADICQKNNISQLVAMRCSDRPPQTKLEAWCKEQGIPLETTPNDMFLTPQATFSDWAETHKRTQMEVFYRWQRKRLGVLMEGKEPEGGAWNYDAENRRPLPKDDVVPAIDRPELTEHSKILIPFVAEHFADHPGELDIWWLPTTRQQSLDWLQQFLAERLVKFGVYEDAMKSGEVFLYHSALSALMNVGLLHPKEVVEAALATDAPLASREGFIRQIIGWREFMFSLYHYKPLDWKHSNSLGQTKKLEPYWWTLDGDAATEPPFRDVLNRVRQYGYAHHIERLMVLGNYMLLAGYDPAEVYEWFLCMFVDAYEWVMVPNIIGMSQYADGGLDNGGFATKPYISGSNYLQKMGKWWPTGATAKESSFTPMYWDFLDRHKDVLQNNHRLRPLYANRARQTKK